MPDADQDRGSRILTSRQRPDVGQPLVEFEFNASRTVLHGIEGPPAGPPIVFLHGVSRCWQTFLPLLAPMTLRWRIVALDFRGHGKSGRVSGGYRVVDYVEDALSLLATVGEPAIVYGHSLGALVAAAAAAARPELVRAVVLEDPPGGDFMERLQPTGYHALFTAMRLLAGEKRPVAEVARLLADTRLPAADGAGEVRLAAVRDAASIRFSARCLADVDPDVFTPILERRWIDGFDAHTVWRGIRCPVLLMRADEARGGMLSSRSAEALVGQVADCTPITLTGVGHIVHWEETETVLKLVLGFLQSL
ncbi:MAG: alpha/beta fold hydrolase [Planctomycetaceae bacterium]